MARSYYNIPKYKVIRNFGSNVFPCKCHREYPLGEAAMYQLTTVTGTRNKGANNPIIKCIIVECEECGSRYEVNIERFGIYQNDLYV